MISQMPNMTFEKWPGCDSWGSRASDGTTICRVHGNAAMRQSAEASTRQWGMAVRRDSGETATRQDAEAANRQHGDVA